MLGTNTVPTDFTALVSASLESACEQALASNLKDEIPSPIAVGYSGGGDSTALLHVLCNRVKGSNIKTSHSKAANIPAVYALIVNHNLRDEAEAEAEAQLAAKNARAMGAIPLILTWHGDKPKTAIQNKARQARYRLMGAACRQHGIKTLWLGHHQDDQIETVYMRASRGSGWRGLAGMRAVSAGNIWPALYQTALVRPLLTITRETLRGYNQHHGLSFIDDPSNQDRRYQRVRARQFLSESPSVKPKLVALSKTAQLGLTEERATLRDLSQSHVTHFPWGGIHVTRAGWEIAPVNLRAHWLQIILLSVSGQTQLSSPTKRSHLVEKMTDKAFNGATLGGVMVTPYENDQGTDHQDGFLFIRDPGAVLGRSDLKQNPALSPQAVSDFWDGRFYIQCEMEEDGPLTIQALGHIQTRLSKLQKQPLSQIPAAARASLPCLVTEKGVEIFPVQNEQNSDNTAMNTSQMASPNLKSIGVKMRSLVSSRYNDLLR